MTALRGKAFPTMSLASERAGVTAKTEKGGRERARSGAERERRKNKSTLAVLSFKMIQVHCGVACATLGLTVPLYTCYTCPLSPSYGADLADFKAKSAN